jgi:uncharacterized protein YdeI (YjbR/CyaY-like superfamily)
MAPASGKTASPADIPVIGFADKSAFRDWLKENHKQAAGIWIHFAKKNSGIPSVTYHEALDVALCYGWIDGLKKSHDAKTFVQKFTPRRARSIWSKINRDKALALVANGQMRAAGLAEMERAKKDGRWEAAYESQSRAQIPDDLQLALDANPRAAKFFATISSQNRYAILFRIHNAKKAETRAKKIAQFVEMLERKETIHP